MTADLSEIRDIYPFKQNFFKVKKYNYHYVDEGSGDPVVMLHGNLSWSFMYRDLIKELSTNHRVIAPDHLGCGLSDKPQDFEYRLETHIDNLESFLLSLKLEKINLVMHGWGAAIGMGFAIRHPAKIKGLLILNSAAFSVDNLPVKIGLCRVPYIGDALVRKTNFLNRNILRICTVKKLSEKVRHGFLMPYDSYENRIAILRFIQDISRGPADPSYEVLLEVEHGLWMFRENPVCIIWGMKDWYYKPTFLERWRLYYPQAKIMHVQNAGHFLLEDTGSEIISFISKCCAEMKHNAPSTDSDIMKKP